MTIPCSRANPREKWTGVNQGISNHKITWLYDWIYPWCQSEPWEDLGFAMNLARPHRFLSKPSGQRRNAVFRFQSDVTLFFTAKIGHLRWHLSFLLPLVMNKTHPGWKTKHAAFLSMNNPLYCYIFIGRICQKINELVNIKLLLFVPGHPESCCDQSFPREAEEMTF